jgi:putative transposase
MRSVLRWGDVGGAALGELTQFIEETSDGRELKRAISVKLRAGGMATEAVSEVLHVPPRTVRAWSQRYEREGIEGLRVQYRGSESYLSMEQRQAIGDWLGAQVTITVEEVRDEIEARYGIVYQSKQSYYDLMDASGLSYHRSEKGNPKRNEAQVLERRDEIKKNWHRGGRRSSAET